jgi:hypothetical protein
MKTRNWMWAIALVLSGVFAGPKLAEAQIAFVPMANSYTALGRFSGSNQTYLVSSNLNTGACSRVAVGGSGGLPAGTTQIFGTAAVDVVVIVSSTTTWCGPWGNMLPPTRSLSNWINVNAGDDTDWLIGNTARRVRLGGDNGNDIVGSNGTTSDVELYGFNGTDSFQAGTNAKVFGENDADTLCVHPGQTVAQFWGGAGADRYCGAVTFVNDASPLCPCP